MELCVDQSTYREVRLDKVLTQYRESSNLLGMIGDALDQLHETYDSICDLPADFDILTATEAQLTLVGHRMGWPREHCVCELPPLFGFNCDGAVGYKGLCEDAVWLACAEGMSSDVAILDDDLYRAQIMSRAYQLLGYYEEDSLKEAAHLIWGEDTHIIPRLGGVIVWIARSLTTEEARLLPVNFRVLPIAPGITPYYFTGSDPVFGFGQGWGGLCEVDTRLMCPALVRPYDCAI